MKMRGPLVQTAGIKVFLFLILCQLSWWLLFAFNVTLLRMGILVSECRLLGALGHTSYSQYQEGHMGICPENSNLHIICLQWWGLLPAQVQAPSSTWGNLLSPAASQ